MSRWALVCSGSALTLEECEFLEKSDFNLCAVNCAWVAFSFYRVQILYGMDFAFWQTYNSHIESNAARWTSNQLASKQYGLNFDQRTHQPFEVNSGLRACMFLLRKYNLDCLYIFGLGGNKHFHADHNIETHKHLTNPDEVKIKNWSKRWGELKHYLERYHPKTQVFNGSKKSEINSFPYQKIF